MFNIFKNYEKTSKKIEKENDEMLKKHEKELAELQEIFSKINKKSET